MASDAQERPRQRPPLAELHLHLYGRLSADAMLRQLQQHRQHLDLTAYEAAYGTRSPVHEVLASCAAGDPAGPERFAWVTPLRWGSNPRHFLQPGFGGAATQKSSEHVRSESAAERIDQLRYDLKHAAGLERHSVVIDRSAVGANLERLLRGPASAPVAHVYDETRLAAVRRRQDYAMSQVKGTGAVIEVCPTSNRRIGSIALAQPHPVHRFLDAGLPVVVASDDPGIFGTTLSAELDWVTHQAELSPTERHALLENAWHSRSERLTGRQD